MKPRVAVIVVAPDSSVTERYAAAEFQRFFESASGLLLPIVEEADEATPRVLIGPGAADIDTSDLGPEDLRVVVQESTVAIAGGRPRGTLYGVYAFLEEVLGVRFLTPDHTHVPRLPDDFVCEPMDRLYRPPLRFRWCKYGEMTADHAFASRMGTNTVQEEEQFGGKCPLILINHTFSNYMPWAQYGQKHPEYYNEIDGERPTETFNDHFSPGVQLCCTNPDVVRIVTEGVLRDLEQDPARGNISVSQNDSNRNCRCERCRAIDEAEGTSMGSLLTLVNAVADAVGERHPDVLVGTLAYVYSRRPPRAIRPRPNVQIQLASIECCQVHPIDDPECPLNPGFCDDLLGWAQISDHVYVWSYVTNFHNYLIPCPNLRVLAKNVRFFVDNGVKGLLMQGPAALAELAGLRNYIISNLIWDPTRDASELLDEFLGLHYGRAGGPIRRYIDLVHDVAEASGAHKRCFGAAADYGLSPELGQEGLGLFDEAMRQAESDVIRDRVEKASISSHALMAGPVIEPAFQKVRLRTKGDDTPPPEIDPGIAEQVLPQLKTFLALCRKYGVPRIGELASFDDVVQVLRETYADGAL